MHTMENDRIVTPWKMEENSLIENARMENTHHGKWQKSHTGKCKKFITTK